MICTYKRTRTPLKQLAAMRHASEAEQVPLPARQRGSVGATHHLLQCSTAPERAREVCQAAHKGREELAWNGG